MNSWTSGTKSLLRQLENLSCRCKILSHCFDCLGWVMSKLWCQVNVNHTPSLSSDSSRQHLCECHGTTAECLPELQQACNTMEDKYLMTFIQTNISYTYFTNWYVKLLQYISHFVWFDWFLVTNHNILNQTLNEYCVISLISIIYRILLWRKFNFSL